LAVAEAGNIGDKKPTSALTAICKNLLSQD